MRRPRLQPDDDLGSAIAASFVQSAAGLGLAAMNYSHLLIGDIFRAGARAVPNRPAAVMGDRQLTYGELDRAANRVAHTVQSMGVGYGDRVVMWSNTDLDACPLFGGLAKLGAVFAPANALLKVDEAVEMVGLARPSLLVVDDDHLDAGGEVASRVGVPLLRLCDSAPLDAPDDDVHSDELRETDLHVLFFTSGTTGASKGVMLSHRVNYLRTHPGGLIDPRGAYVCMYPLFHMGAWTLSLQAWQSQVPMVYVGAEAKGLVEAIDTWKATHFNAIPAVWRRILDHLAETGEHHRLDSLIVADSGTSATPLELLRAIQSAAANASVRVYYGSTEAGAVTYLRNEEIARKPGSCGVPHHSTQIELAPDTGEMLIRGPLLFDGYFDNPDATSAVFTSDGWFRTGDCAAIDDEGFYSIVGRVKDVIRTGGETVSPSEVESVFRGHPAFRDFAVVGIPDPQWGEVVCLAAVLADGSAAPTLDELAAFCEDKLAKFKRPRRFEVVDTIPRTPATLQPVRRLLIEHLLSR
jgi:acyl-CoA synthetase (AMP-forming)/AMP-acid ligase II